MLRAPRARFGETLIAYAFRRREGLRANGGYDPK